MLGPCLPEAALVSALVAREPSIKNPVAGDQTASWLFERQSTPERGFAGAAINGGETGGGEARVCGGGGGVSCGESAGRRGQFEAGRR